jgi:sirohydrochlorin ferrochelatase
MRDHVRVRHGRRHNPARDDIGAFRAKAIETAISS